MSVKQVNLGNFKKSCTKDWIRVSFAQDSLKCQNQKLRRLVFEQEKDPVVQWLSCIIIQKLTIRLKVNIEVKCVNLRELKYINADSM